MRPLPSATLEMVTFLEEGPAGGQDPQTVREPVPGWGSPAARPGEAGKEAERFPRPVAEDAPLGGAAIAANEEGSQGPRCLRSPEVAPQGHEVRQVPGRRASERGERESYLAGLAGVGEGVDVLRAEVHHAAVDAVEIGAPGRVAGVAARDGWRRPQEPGQRAEQGEPRAAGHGGRRARRAAEPPPGQGERRAGPCRAPRAPGARSGAARAMDAPQTPPRTTRWGRTEQTSLQTPGVSAGGHGQE